MNKINVKYFSLTIPRMLPKNNNMQRNNSNNRFNKNHQPTDVILAVLHMVLQRMDTDFRKFSK